MNRFFTRKAATFFCLLAVFLASLLICTGDAHATVGQRNHSINLHPIEKMKPNGEYIVEVRDKDSWHKAGTVSCDRFYREQEVDLSQYALKGKEIIIRITEKGGGAAHIDAALLGNISPTSVTGADEKQALKKISQKDFDVIDACQKSIELTFPAQSTEQKLKLIARIEDTTISKVPFQFPRENLYREMNEHSQFYRYKLNSSSKNTGGADITKGKPFFKEYSPTGSGHPSGFTYGWVAHDDKDLHVYLDFTPDNTMDGNKDYATVYAKTASGLKAYKVSMAEQKWGRPEFTYTERVSYQHKAYRFNIPLKELGINQDEKTNKEIQLAFAAYGTANPGNDQANIAYDSLNNRYLMVYVKADYSYNSAIYGQLLNWDGSLYGSEIAISGSNDHAYSPSVVYDSSNQRFLVAWDDQRNSATTGADIFGQLITAAGALSGGNIALCTEADNQYNPSVAFDNVNQRFLVAWYDYRNSATTGVDIYGQLFTAGGSRYSLDFPVCNAAGNQYSASVAYDTANQRFLVAWNDERNGATNSDIYGQLITAEGGLYSGNIAICTVAEDQYEPSVAYDSTNKRFLVVWQDERDFATRWDIYGQLITAGGGLYGGNIAICTAASTQYISPVAYDNINRRFLVVWMDHRNSATTGWDIYGQLVTDGGSLSGGNIPVCTAVGEQTAPTIAYNVQKKNFLIAYNVYAGGLYYIGSTLFPRGQVYRDHATMQIAGGYYHTVGLKANGSVVAAGDNNQGQCQVSSWRRIVQVAAGDVHTLGLKADGTVVAVGRSTEGQCNVSGWSNIVQVAAGAYHTLGLKADGTVVAVGRSTEGQCNVSGWSNIVQVAAGAYHTLGLKADGTVVAVGDNSSGQRNVSGWTDIVQVASGGGSFHTVGLKADGTVVAVGDNSFGQCNVSGWSNIEQVATEYVHTVGLKADGTVVAVGYNGDGQCNVSSWTDIVQVAVSASHTVGLRANGNVVSIGGNATKQSTVSSWNLLGMQVAAGSLHTIGLKEDGTVVAVGDNSYGQCNVSGWSGIMQKAGGSNHTVGLKADGTVVAVGDNSYGQCNVGSWSDIVQVAGGSNHTVGLKADGTVVAVGNNGSGQCNVFSWTDIVHVSAGIYHTVGLKADGTVVAVGDNANGQCNVSGWNGIVQVAAGGYHTVGLKADGSVVAVGYNAFGQCNVSGWSGIVQVAAGGYHTVGLKADGTVVAVGVNDSGQCNVSGWTGIVQVAAGGSHTLMLRADGSVKAVGYNGYGQCNVAYWNLIGMHVALGYKHTVGLKSDGTVVAVGNCVGGQCNVWSWSNIIQISADGYYTVGLKKDGSVEAVGANTHGQCNVGSWNNIVQVVTGYGHTVGVRADGTVVAVGDNTHGQLNVGSWSDVVQVAAGDWYTVGLKGDGTLVAVGENDYGQCNVGGLTNIVQVAAGYGHTIGLRADGTVVALGYNSDGQCNVGGWTNIVQVAAGSYFTLGLRADGTVVAVGDNAYNQCDVQSWEGIVQVAGGNEHTVGLHADGTVVAVGNNTYGQCDVSDWYLLTEPDADGDGILGVDDNCPNKPNGPNLGTCMPGSDKSGAACTSDADCVIGCSSNGSCSMNQEDSDADGIGDVCDIDNLIKALVREYYLDILGREPDAGGWNYWTNEIKRIISLGIYAGEGFQAEARFFFNSTEYLNKNKTASAFVTDLYHTFLQREPDSAGLNYWVGQLACLSRNMLITQFAYSAEFQQLMTDMFGADTTRPENNLINDFYRGFLNRFPDDGGFNAYLNEMGLAQCTSADAVKKLSYQIALAFVQSAEYAARNRNNTQYVEDLYNGILRRGADCAGFTAWRNALNGGATRANVLKSFTDSPEFQGRVNAVIAAGCLM